MLCKLFIPAQQPTTTHHYIIYGPVDHYLAYYVQISCTSPVIYGQIGKNVSGFHSLYSEVQSAYDLSDEGLKYKAYCTIMKSAWNFRQQTYVYFGEDYFLYHYTIIYVVIHKY